MSTMARTSVQPHKHPPHTTVSRSLAEASKLSQHRSQFSQNHISPSGSPPPLTVRYPTSQAPSISTPPAKPAPSTQPSKPSPSVQPPKPSMSVQPPKPPTLQAPSIEVPNLQEQYFQSSAPPQLSPQHVPMQPLSKPPAEPPLLQPVIKGKICFR